MGDAAFPEGADGQVNLSGFRGCFGIRFKVVANQGRLMLVAFAEQVSRKPRFVVRWGIHNGKWGESASVRSIN